jgi:hypothetical protein
LLTSDVGVDVEVFDGGRHFECCCCCGGGRVIR